MRSRLTWLIVAVVSLLCRELSFALTVTVAPEGGTADFNSIQAAINHCSSNNPGSTNHTIRIAGGTFDYREGGAGTGEETFWAHDGIPWDATADGLGHPYSTQPRISSKSLIVVNDVTEDLDGDGQTNGYLNGLVLSGGWNSTFTAGTGAETIVDAEKASDYGRVMYVKNSNVRLDGITLKGGRFNTQSYAWYYGCGLLVHGAGVRLIDVKVSDCEIVGGNYNSGCVNLGGYHDGRNVPTNFVIERMDISGYSGAGGALDVFEATPGIVANSRIHDNAATGVYTYNADSVVLYGLLIDHNVGSGILSDFDTDGMFVVNTTVLGNNGYGYSQGSWVDGGCFLNCVFTGNTNGMSADPAKPVSFLNCNLADTLMTGGFNTNGYGTVLPLTGTCSLAPANLDARYRPTSTSPAYGGGRSITTNDFTFVDIQNNGVYNEGLDIVIAGTPPADPDGDDRVYTFDILNVRRLRWALDMGCIETRPAAGTVITLK